MSKLKSYYRRQIILRYEIVGQLVIPAEAGI